MSLDERTKEAPLHSPVPERSSIHAGYVLGYGGVYLCGAVGALSGDFIPTSYSLVWSKGPNPPNSLHLCTMRGLEAPGFL